jgi:hypothetical protein
VYEEYQNTNRRVKRSVRHEVYGCNEAHRPAQLHSPDATAVISSHNDPNRTVRCLIPATLFATVARVTVAKVATKTRLLVNSYEMKQVSRVY